MSLYNRNMQKNKDKTPLTEEEKRKLLEKTALKTQAPTEKQWGVEYPYFSTALRVGKKKLSS